MAMGVATGNIGAGYGPYAVRLTFEHYVYLYEPLMNYFRLVSSNTDSGHRAVLQF